MTFIKSIEQDMKEKSDATKNSGLELSLISLIILFVMLLITVVIYNVSKTDLLDLPPLVVLFSGFILSFSIFAILHIQVILKLRAVRLAKKLTAELKQEAELRNQQKSLFEAILRNVGNAIIVVDVNQRLVLMNKVAEEYTLQIGKEYKDELLSTILNISLGEKECDTLEKAVDQVLKTKKTYEIFPFGNLKIHTSPDIPVRGNIEIIDKGDGSVVGVVISLMDVTKERSLEQEKDDFISMAVHQLKTPTTGLRWQVEMINSGDFGEIPERLRQPILEVSVITKKIIGLVNDFLQISRITQNRVSDNPESVKIIKMVTEIIAEIKPISEEKNISVSFESVKETDLEIHIDKQRFHDVIENLVSNAVKYNTMNGSVSIHFDQLKDSFSLSVRDTGIGIPKKDQKKIFTRFFRAGNAVKSESEGTGLGLYMIKSYIEAWGGSITIDSEENKGTMVTVTIPKQVVNHVLDKNLQSNDQS